MTLFGTLPGNPNGQGRSPFERWGTSGASAFTPSTPTDGTALQTVASGKAGGADATQATASARPIYDEGTIKDLPLLRFTSGRSLTIALSDDVQYGIIQIDTDQLADGDVILSRPTSQSGTSKDAFQIRVVDV